MGMKWSYKVAGLRFSIEGANPALLASMTNLTPFVSLEAGEDIFTLHFVPVECSQASLKSFVVRTSLARGLPGRGRIRKR